MAMMAIVTRSRVPVSGCGPFFQLAVEAREEREPFQNRTDLNF